MPFVGDKPQGVEVSASCSAIIGVSCGNITLLLRDTGKVYLQRLFELSSGRKVGISGHKRTCIK